MLEILIFRFVPPGFQVSHLAVCKYHSGRYLAISWKCSLGIGGHRHCFSPQRVVALEKTPSEPTTGGFALLSEKSTNVADVDIRAGMSSVDECSQPG